MTVRGYFLRYNRQKWMMREIIWNIWAANSMSDNFSLTRQGLMLLPWDEEEPPMVEPTMDELEEINRRFDAALNDRMRSNPNSLIS